MSFQEGHYIIRPKDAPTDTVLIGPVPITAPDVPVRHSNHPLTENWLVQKAPNSSGKYTIYSGRGRPLDYKWIVKKPENSNLDILYVSSKSQSPAEFSITSETEFWVITYGADALAATAVPNKNEVVFRPQDGSSAQRFIFEPQPEY